MIHKSNIILASASPSLVGKHNPISIQANADGKTTEINIEGAIGGDYDWMSGDVSGATKEGLKAELKSIGAIKGDKIIVNINSLGGDLNHGLSIHDLLASNPAKKEVRINGMTASSATVIAMAGDEIKMSENALFLVHRSSTLAMGNRNNVQAVLDMLDKADARQADIYAKKTGQTTEAILAKMDINNGDGEWLDSTEAKAFGFINESFAPTAIAASVDHKLIAEMKLPAIPEGKIKNKNSDNMKDQKTLVDSIVAGVKAILAPKADDKITVDAINAAAEKEALKLKAEFDESVKTAAGIVKTDLEAAHKTVVDAKEEEITKLKASIAEKETEIAKLNGKETTPTGASADPNPGASVKRKLSKNEKSAALNAAALRGEKIEEEDEEEEA